MFPETKATVASSAIAPMTKEKYLNGDLVSLKVNRAEIPPNTKCIKAPMLWIPKLTFTGKRLTKITPIGARRYKTHANFPLPLLLRKKYTPRSQRIPVTKS